MVKRFYFAWVIRCKVKRCFANEVNKTSLTESDCLAVQNAGAVHILAKGCIERWTRISYALTVETTRSTGTSSKAEFSSEEIHAFDATGLFFPFVALIPSLGSRISE